MPVERRGASDLVVDNVGHVFSELPEGFGVDAGNKQAAGAFDKALGDGDNLLWCLSLAKHDLGQGGTQGAMMVNLCEAQVLVGQVTETLESAFHVRGTGGDGIEEGTKVFFVDRSTSQP